MQHFSTIQALCRIGLGEGNEAFRHQVDRLRLELTKAGEDEQAAKIQRLLDAQERSSALQPSRIARSRAAFAGEQMTSRVSPPVDRDTSVPLAQIMFPDTQPNAFPILSKDLSSALESLVNEWSHIKELEKLNVEPARTCLLYGLPGTGKTRIAYALSSRLGLPLVSARLDGIVGSFLGTTSRNIASLFEFANRYQCLLLLDEFDAIAKLRDDPQEIGEIKRVVNTLLQNLDGRVGKGFTIAITNHDSLLDPAVWRRFEVRIQVPPPDLKARSEIVKMYLAPLQYDSPERTTAVEKLLAWFSEGLTGADIETMIRNLKRYAILHPDGDALDGLRAYVLTHAGNGDRMRADLVLGPQQDLASALIRRFNFTQGQVASIAGVNQSTVARWLGPRDIAE